MSETIFSNPYSSDAIRRDVNMVDTESIKVNRDEMPKLFLSEIDKITEIMEEKDDGENDAASACSNGYPPQPSTLKGLFMVASAVVISLFTAGIIFGYAAIQPIFITEGAYGYMCEDGKTGCVDQVLMLNLMFFIASIALSISALMGIVGDYIGPRLMSVTGTVFEIIGLLLMAFSSDTVP
eukprot:Ihof_evm5s736 gene=Ihof_evmTU5s736